MIPEGEIRDIRRNLVRYQEELQMVRSQIHRDSSSAPELKIPLYEGKTDPRAHMPAFCIAMGRTYFNDGERDADYCLIFIESMVGAALNWLSRLEANTVDNFNQLSTIFMKNYSMFIE
ncbi:hypothetical protein Bca4012_037745 [Brassica carinata]